MKNLRKTLVVLLSIVATNVAMANFSMYMSSVDNSELVAAYLAMKDALVKTNAKDASSSASILAELLSGKKDELSIKLKSDAEAISKSTDIKIQRKHFSTLSQSMYDFVKASGNKQQGRYKQYCPMAFNNTGAFWLASEKEINNPYFGSMMLRCGVVQESINN
jgi:hypothetical protein